MNYSSEIRSIMEEAHSLNDEIEARRKANRREGEYWRLLTRHRGLEHREDELRKQAAEDFAALNGWRWTVQSFLARTLARGGPHEGMRDGGSSWGPFGARDETMDGWISHILFDHAVFFREIARPYRTAAIVGQPYNTGIVDARANAAKIGLVLHVPPNLTASWWNPGHTRFFCFTRPEIQHVRFLPEQMEPAHDEELERERNRYNFEVEDAKRYFGEWDSCDPVVWAILRVVQAQNDLAHAINETSYGYPAAERMVEAAIAERREAIADLQKAFEEEPRGFQ